MMNAPATAPPSMNAHSIVRGSARKARSVSTLPRGAARGAPCQVPPCPRARLAVQCAFVTPNSRRPVSRLVQRRYELFRSCHAPMELLSHLRRRNNLTDQA